MNTNPSSNATDLPVYGEDPGTYYSLEVVAELAGVDAGMVLHYQEQGFLRPVPRQDSEATAFDADSLRQLRRIEHLRATCEMNEAGLKLILSLLEEVEQLREERRQLLR
jgi:MerR family transcriptional regulator/heat shock protein HspR